MNTKRTTTKLDVAQRRNKVVELYHRNRLSMEETACEIGVSVATVSRDVEWLRQEAMSAASEETKRKLAEFNRELEDIKGEAWRAYRRSLLPKQVETQETSCRDEALALEEPEGEDSPAKASSANSRTPAPARRMTKRVRTEQDGDARYFAIIISAIEKQARLFGVGGFGKGESGAANESRPPVVVYLPDNGRGPQPWAGDTSNE